MPSTRDIRRRIKSVKSTSQITQAMQLVAAAKMKKAQDQATNGRPYADLMNKVLVSLKAGAPEEARRYAELSKGSRTLVLLITSDKGLCGALNTNLVRKLGQTDLGDEVEFITIGRKGAGILSRLKKNLLADFPIKDPVRFADVRPVGKLIQERYLSGEYRQVLVAFNNFVNTVTTVPSIEQLLPINPVTLGGKREFEGMGSGHDTDDADSGPVVEYSFEPSADEVLAMVLPLYVNNLVYQMVLEARASEHSSRMVAMKNATDNAKQMLKDLSLEYNKLRQASITNELLEITTAKMALE
jgi:F-type H+-transporting ATPase subunit gamma